MLDTNKLVAFLREAFLEVFGDNLISLILFGSWARGEQRPDSDIDILIVLEEVGDRYYIHKKIDAIEDMLFKWLVESGYSGLKPYISPVIYDKRTALRFRPLYLDIVFDYKIIVDRHGFMEGVLERLRSRMKEWGSKRVYMGNFWYVDLKPGMKLGEVIEFE